MKKVLKLFLIVIGVIVALIALLTAGIALFLTPERLARWVREYGTEYLVDGQVDVRSIDLSVLAAWPYADLSIDSLRVDNAAVPEEYSTVLSVDRLEGRINLAALFAGQVRISDVTIVRPCATVWYGADSAANSLSILPPSSSSETDDSAPFLIPDIRFSRFDIEGDGLLRYVSEPDSIDASLTIHRTQLRGDNAPEYSVKFSGGVGVSPLLSDSLTVGIGGNIGWMPSEPLAISLTDFKVDIDSLHMSASVKADFSNSIRLDDLDFRLEPVELKRLAELAARIPQVADMVPAIGGNAAVSLAVRLTEPYTYSADTVVIPDLRAAVKIEDAPLSIPSYYLALTNFGLEIEANLSSSGLDESTVNLKRLAVRFPASDFTLTAKMRNLASNPAASGCFKGRVNFSNLNPRVWTLLGMRLRGVLNADVDFNLTAADLTPNTFHRARLNGEADLREFEALMPSDTITAGVTQARLNFGSGMKFGDVDSLLAATLTADSAWVHMAELSANMTRMKLGVGVLNNSHTLDTTQVTPMGGRLTVDKLRYESSADSSRALVRGLDGNLSLRRYKGEDRAPQLQARLSTRRIVYADGVSRMALRGADISFGAYRTPRRKRQRRVLTHADSVRFAARRDSLLMAQPVGEKVDFGVDRSAVTLLRRWHVTGAVKAAGGRIITPLFPLRTRMKDLNLTFNADSVMLNSLKITTGRSDFSLKGSITDIQRAVGARRVVRPLKVRLDLMSDTINVNQLIQTAFRGAASGADASAASVEVDESDLDRAESEVEADTAEMRAIVVPFNVDAELNFAARNIIYSTMALRNFRGTVAISNGAAHLAGLHADTDIGSANLNMLYYAPTRADVEFAIALNLRRFQVGRVTELIPALDSIMPMLNTLGGIVNASVTATTPVDSMMNIRLPQLKAMIALDGDSLTLLNEETFKTVSKWLLFKDKNKNMIDHMDVLASIEQSRMNLYPFVFDFDRYKIGVMGGNDLNLNLDYHVSVLKSPLPFKFGINITGTADKMKVRLGRARLKENMVGQTVELSDTLRLNLAREMMSVFRRGARNARMAPLDVKPPARVENIREEADTISAADSIYFIQQGLIAAPDSIR